MKSNYLKWNNFNYPPLIRLFHYSTERLQNPIQRVVRVLHYSFLAYLVLCVINFLNNIVLAACGVNPGIYILYSILNLFILVPFSLFVFYSGFYGLCKRPRTCHMLAYRISQGIQCGLWLVFSILSAGPFNGWSEISSLNGSGGQGFAIFLCVIESLGYTALMIIGSFCLFFSFKYQDNNPLKEVPEQDTDVRV